VLGKSSPKYLAKSKAHYGTVKVSGLSLNNSQQTDPNDSVIKARAFDSKKRSPKAAALIKSGYSSL
jgi:hypothetical protein